MRRIIKGGVLLWIILMFFCGCSSNKGSSGNLSNSFLDYLNSHSYYKFYIDTNTSSLYAVNPNNPKASSYVDNVDDCRGDLLFDYIVGGQYNISSHKVSNIHMGYIVYSKNGSIYRVSTDINNGLKPIKVSSLNTKICNLSAYSGNINNLDHDFILVETAGPDGVCEGYCATTSTNYSDDNQDYLVRLDMSSTDTPIIVPQDYSIEGTYFNYSTGNIGGVFIDNNGTYEACDENLSNCRRMVNGYQIDLMGDYPGKVYLCINGTKVYSFDKNSKILTFIYKLPTYLDDYISDKDGNIYFDSNSTIYKLDTAYNSVIPLYHDSQGIDRLVSTDNKIVYSTHKAVYTTNAYGYNVYDYTVYSIKMLNKMGGIPITICSFNSTRDDYDIITTDDKIFICNINTNINNAIPRYYDEKIYDEKGTLLNIINGEKIGVQFANSGDIVNIINMINDDNIVSIGKILIVDPLTSTLKVLSTKDLSIKTIAYPLPGDIVKWGRCISGNDIFLITGYKYNSYNYNSFSADTFFVDTSKSNSLVRVTNTPDYDESLSSW